MHDLVPHSQTFAERIFQRVARRATIFPSFPSQGRYNLTVSDSPPFVWYRVAKAGTRSIFRFFREAGVAMRIENGIFLHTKPNLIGEHLKFAFVRNPWDRFVSCFYDRVVDRNHFGFPSEEHQRMKNISDFLDFVENLDVERCDVHLRLQSALIDLNNLDFLGRVENFDDDFPSLLSRLGLPLPERSPRENASSRPSKNIEDVLRPAQIERVGKIYEKDIRLFGYRSP